MSNNRTERVVAQMSPAEVAALDEFRRTQTDLPSRAEAIRRLIRVGLEAEAPILAEKLKVAANNQG